MSLQYEVSATYSDRDQLICPRVFQNPSSKLASLSLINPVVLAMALQTLRNAPTPSSRPNGDWTTVAVGRIGEHLHIFFLSLMIIFGKGPLIIPAMVVNPLFAGAELHPREDQIPPATAF